MKLVDIARKLFAVGLIAGVTCISQASSSIAQEFGLVGTWRTMIGSPSNYGQPSASVVFTTTFTPDGSYRTIAVVEGGDGMQGAGGYYVMTGHYNFQAPSFLQYRLETSVLCVGKNYCSPRLAPGQRLGAAVSVDLQFDGYRSFFAGGQYWTRLQ